MTNRGPVSDDLKRQYEWEAENGPWLPPCAACGGTGRVMPTGCLVIFTSRPVRCDVCWGTGKGERK